MLKNPILFIISLAILSITSCTVVPPYEDPLGPVWEATNSHESLECSEELSVLSFNIKYAEKIDLAIADIQSSPELSSAKVFLLQEMSEEAVQKIAQHFEMNYLYYPAVFHKSKGHNFGNAILSKFPLVNKEKIILPHKNGKRIAVYAQIKIGQSLVHLYSIHNETIKMSLNRRIDQAQSIIDHANKITNNQDPIIIGGDFNTAFNRSKNRTINLFESSGFACPSKELGPTSTALGGLIKPAHDHFFTKNCSASAVGKTISKASDHRPIWIRLKLDCAN